MSVFVPLVVVMGFIRSVLAADATVVAQLGGTARIHPNVSPSTIGRNRHLVQTFAGPEGGIRAAPLGQALSQITLRMDLTGWEPDYDQAALEPLMEAVQTALIGADGRGKRHVYTDGADSYRLEVEYGGPVLVPLELQPAGVWAPISERYQIALRKAA